MVDFVVKGCNGIQDILLRYNYNAQMAHFNRILFIDENAGKKTNFIDENAGKMAKFIDENAGKTSLIFS